MGAIWVGLILALMVAGVGCLSISDWHSSEADYWSRVALWVRLDPSLDATYRPILDWKHANPPSLWERVWTWKSPEERMAASPAPVPVAAPDEENV